MNPGIEVFFTQVNRPWSNALPGTYYVNVYDPMGPVLVGVPAPNGRASIDLPPGRYLVTGTLHGIYVNFDSNESMVNVGCGDRVCVTVIPRSLHFCIWWLTAALELITRQPLLAPKVAPLAKAALEPLRRIEQAIPREHRQLEYLARALDPLRGARSEEPAKVAETPRRGRRK